MALGIPKEPEYLDEYPPIRPLAEAITDAWADLEGSEERRAELHYMKYANFLRSDEWKETRKAILRRAGYKCERCGAHGMLHVHHETYARRGFEDLADLEALCAPCHEEEHGIG